MVQGEKAQCMPASVFGYMQQVADSVISPYIHKEEMVSSYIFPYSVGIWAIPTAPSVNVSSMFGVRLRVPFFTLPGYSRKF